MLVQCKFASYVSRDIIYSSGFASYIILAQNPRLTEAAAYVICGLRKRFKMYRLYGKFQCYVSHGLCTPWLIFSYKWPYYLRELARNGGSNLYKHVRWVSPIIIVWALCDQDTWNNLLLVQTSTQGRKIVVCIPPLYMWCLLQIVLPPYCCVPPIQAYTPDMRLKITSKENKPIFTTIQGGTPLYRLYRYVRPQRAWFFCCAGHK